MVEQQKFLPRARRVRLDFFPGQIELLGNLTLCNSLESTFASTVDTSRSTPRGSPDR